MFRIGIQNGYVVNKEEMNHLALEQIEERKQLGEIFLDDRLVKDKRLPAVPIYEGEAIVDIQELPNIQYTVDKTVITTLEAAVMTISDPAVVTAVIDEQEYEITDGSIEYSNENPGNHEIILKAEGYYDAHIQIEVVEA